LLNWLRLIAGAARAGGPSWLPWRLVLAGNGAKKKTGAARDSIIAVAYGPPVEKGGIAQSVAVAYIAES
jgi:hypothetical protein